jgi:hypothetical protein
MTETHKYIMGRAPKIDQWTPGIRPTWDVAQVKSALYEHQTGCFGQSSMLVEAMYADDELPTSLDRAVNMIAGASFVLQPETDEDGEPIENSEVQAAALLPIWTDCFPEHEIAKLIRWFIMLGVAVGTIDWDTSGGIWMPRLRALHPEFLHWDDATRDPQTGLWGVFRYQVRDGADEIVTPGDGRWVLLSDGRESWMRCSLRALATTWLVKQYAWRDWSRYSERHGLPIVVAKIPAVASSEDKSTFFSDLRSLNSETTVALPQLNPDEGPNYELELLEAKDRSWDGFQAMIARCDRKFQMHFLGTNTGELEGAAGSRATSESGRNIASEVAAERERRITTDLRDQLVKPFSKYNVPDADLELAPWPHYAVEGEEDLKKSAESVEIFGKAIGALKTAGFDVANIDEWADKYDIKLEKRPEPDPVSAPGLASADPNDSGDDVPVTEQSGDDDRGESGAALDAIPLPGVAEVGARDGFVAGQRYIDGLVGHLTDQATAIEHIAAEEMIEIISVAKTPAEIKARLSQVANTSDPVVLGHLFEKAILLSQLAGMYATQEDM